jgi:hypothetical protein
MGGSDSRASARASRCFSPPDSSSTRFVGVGGQVYFRQQGGKLVVAFHSFQLGVQVQRFQDGQVVVEVEHLGHKADLGTHLFALLAGRLDR